MKKKPTRIISRILSFTLAFMMMFSSFTSASAVDTGRTPESIPDRTYIIGTHEFTSKTALTTSAIMMAARTIQGDNLTEEDMVIYYKNPYGKWINAINGTPIPENELPQSFTITHTDLEGEVVVDKTMLENFISTAKNNRFSTFVSTDGSDVDPLAKWVTQAEMDDYTDAIEAAQTVADKADATLSEVDTALLALSQAMLNFDSAKKDGIVIVSAISVDKEATTLPVGTSETLVVTFDPTNATNKNVTWSSSDAEIATVADGVVTAVSEGTAIITATSNNGKTATTTVTVVAANTVAMIGTTQYADLQNAIDVAAGTTINLVADVVLKTKGLIIGTDKEITLDLAGYVISGVLENVGASALIANNGSLTIEDSSTDKTGKITNQAKNPDNEWEAGFPAYANNTITNSGNLIIDGGRIENTTDGRGASYVIDNNSGNRDAVVIVNEGHIINPNGNFAIRQFANSTVNKNSVTINGGIVEGTRAVWIQLPGSSGQEKLAELTVNGGTLKSTDKGEGGYNLAVYSYTFGDSFAKTKIIITGGTFDGHVALTGGTRKTPMETLEVTGGEFLGDSRVFSYAKIVNETQYKSYATIQEAIDEAAAEETIVVRAGTYTENVNINKSITLKGPNAGGNEVRADEAVLKGKLTVSVEGVVVDGFTVESTSHPVVAVVSAASDVKLLNNKINAVGTAGIGLNRGTGGIIEGNTITARKGITAQTDEKLTIKNNTITSTQEAIELFYDALEGYDQFVVEDNTDGDKKPIEAVYPQAVELARLLAEVNKAIKDYQPQEPYRANAIKALTSKDLGLDLTEFNKLIPGRQPAVANDLKMYGMSTGEYKDYTYEELEETFNSIVAVRSAGQTAADHFNGATSPDNLNYGELLGNVIETYQNNKQILDDSNYGKLLGFLEVKNIYESLSESNQKDAVKRMYDVRENYSLGTSVAKMIPTYADIIDIFEVELLVTKAEEEKTNEAVLEATNARDNLTSNNKGRLGTTLTDWESRLSAALQE